MVSIIVCTYNDSNFLDRALKSCLMQNIQKEIIINAGLSAARNTGIAASSYDYIITLDADDFFFPRSVRTLMHYASKDCDIFHGFMTSSGKVSLPYHKEITKEILLNQNPIFCSSLFRKSIWDKVGGYKIRRGAHYEDWNFWCKCFMAGAKFQFIPTLVYEHTERPDSMLRTLEVDKEKYVTIATEELRNFQ